MGTGAVGHSASVATRMLSAAAEKDKKLVRTIVSLQAAEGICHAGVKPYSTKLLVTEAVRALIFPEEGDRLLHAPKIMNGHDVGQFWRGFYVIDVNDMTELELRAQLPHAYTYLLEHVRPGRMRERNPRLRLEFWRFEANRTSMREALATLTRYIVTLENSPQRYFTFLPSSILPDQKLRVVAVDDAWVLALLSSQAHDLFARDVGGRAGRANTPVYNTECFTRFPFPDPEASLKVKLRALGEELDATRKRVQVEHPDLTLTGLYNVLQRIRAGIALSGSDEDIKHRGLVLILKDLHDQIDALTAAAYGWPADLADEEILDRLVALNAQRVAEEAAGHVRWLRPDYQIPRFAKGGAARSGELALGEAVVAIDKALPVFPADRYEQPLAIEALLAAAGRPMTPAELARGFRRGGKRIEQRRPGPDHP
nr:class I SAM-dependent DNA methyltransferase [Pseudomonadota bacterium]